MPETEDLLRSAFARQERRAPDALRLLPAVRERVRRRRQRAIVGSAVAVALLVGTTALGTLVGQRKAPAPVAAVGHRVDGPPPVTLTVRGVAVRLVGPVELGAARLDPDDPAVLVVEAGNGVPGSPASPCSPHYETRVLAQDDQAVEVAAYQYDTVERLGAGEGCGRSLPPPLQHRLELGRDLGGRTVRSQGALVPVVDSERLLRATTLPTGYRREADLVVGAPRDDPGRSTWVHTGPADTALDVTQGPPGRGFASPELFAGEVVLARPVIRGHPARVSRTGGFTDLLCLSWAEREDLVVSVCSRGSVAPLDAPALVRVAEGLRAPGQR